MNDADIFRLIIGILVGIFATIIVSIDVPKDTPFKHVIIAFCLYAYIVILMISVSR